jgi:hypothetical protein
MSTAVPGQGRKGELQWQTSVCRVRPNGKTRFSACHGLGKKANPHAGGLGPKQIPFLPQKIPLKLHILCHLEVVQCSRFWDDPKSVFW